MYIRAGEDLLEMVARWWFTMYVLQYTTPKEQFYASVRTGFLKCR